MRARMLPFLLFAIGTVGDAAAQAPSCRANVDSLDAKIQRNYAGFRLEVRGERAVSYGAQLGRLRRIADETHGDGCLAVLHELTEWFADPHLFVYQNAEADSAAVRRTAAGVRRTDWTEARVRTYLERNRGRLDAIEGIWYDRDLRVGVVRDSPNVFIAVVLTPDTAPWAAGAVRATLRQAAGYYDVEVISRGFGRRVQRAVIHRNTLLRFSPGIWGREWPVAAADTGFLHPADPRRPTLRLVDGALVFSIPSHDPQYAPVIDSLVRSNAALLRASSRLVIDLRGNEGGSSWMTRSLHPYLASAPSRASGYEGDSAVMLSSPDQIRYARRAFGPDTTAFVRSLIARLEARPGELVPLRENFATAAGAPDSVIEGPRAVAVLVDRGTVSAAEVLVLRALRSTRATVFGEPTAGALDYQSTSIVRLSRAEDRWLLGYPTITRTPSLPHNGMRGIGIAPDVTVQWSAIDDPIRHVLRELERNDRERASLRSAAAPLAARE